MAPVIDVRLVLERDEVQRVLVVLYEPAAPEVRDAFLVARGADHAQGVQVDGALDGVGGLGDVVVDEDGVAL